MDDDLPTAAAESPRAGTDARTLVVVLRDPADGRAVPAWCSHVQALLAEGRADLVTCDVAALDGPVGVVIDALCRVQLAARRSGGSIRLRHARPTLQELLALVGFAELLPVCDRLPGELDGEAEQREQPRVDEGVEADDPTG